MSDIRGSSGTAEVQVPEMGKDTDLQEQAPAPSVDELKGKMEEIFQAEQPEDVLQAEQPEDVLQAEQPEDVPTRQDIPQEYPFEDTDSRTITLDDGTVVELPRGPVYQMYSDNGSAGLSDDNGEMIDDPSVSADASDASEQATEGTESDSGEENLEKPDPVAERINYLISTPEGIKELMEKHPEKAEKWKEQLNDIEKLNDPDASDYDISRAQRSLSQLKGEMLEEATKDALAEAGFDVEPQQHEVAGESGGTRPDVVGVNNTDHPIEVFGTTVQPGEKISVECKCGGSYYMRNQLRDHIPNQLSGQEGTKVLLTTSDINNVEDGLAESVCDKYDAKLVALDVSVSDVEKAIKEVAGE